MSVQMVTSPKIIQSPALQKSSQDSKQDGNEWFNDYVLENPYAHTKASNKLKAGVFFSALAGVTLAMLSTFKAKGIHINSLNGFFTNLTTVKYKKEGHEVEKLVGRLTLGSVGGGLIGGALLDKKENLKAKVREAVIQVIGNIGIPLGCVAGGMHFFENKLESKVVKGLKLGQKTKGIPGVLVSGLCLVTGIFTGNKVGNAINKVVFNSDEKRTLKLSDMSPHIDDLGIAASFVIPPDKPVGHVLTRIIPAALMIAGISTGVAQEKVTTKKTKEIVLANQQKQVEA